MRWTVAVVLAMSFLLAMAFVPATAAGSGVVAGTPPPSVATENPAVDRVSGSSAELPAEVADPPPEEPRIVAVYPNPVTHMDAGEYVELWLPPDSGAVTLSDGHTTVELPANASGRIIVTGEPEEARVAGEPAFVTAPALALADDGDRLRLRGDDDTTHSVSYDRAPEGDRWIPAAGEWRPLGYEPREPRSYGGAEATAFTLPDAPDEAEGTLRTADDRLLLAGYTLTDDSTVWALIDAHDRGVEVRVLLEAEPVGGMDRRQATALDRLTDAGIDVRVLGGSRSRFAYHHPKYAVVDERAIVLTENWKPSGTGGRSSRGWGVTVESPALADGLAELFRNDADAIDATDWATYREGNQFVDSEPADGEFPREIDPEQLRIDRVRLLTGPANDDRAMVEAIEEAEHSVAVIQPRIDPDSELVRASVRAAERGVEVRILLSDAWYVIEENHEDVERLNSHADRRDLPLSARVATPDGRYGKIHAKGLVVDGERVYVGSLNWNSQAADRNREVVLELHGEAVAGYFLAAFEADWGAGDGGFPLGVGAVAVGAVALAAAVARRRISFGQGGPTKGVSGDSLGDPAKPNRAGFATLEGHCDSPMEPVDERGVSNSQRDRSAEEAIAVHRPAIRTGDSPSEGSDDALSEESDDSDRADGKTAR